MRRLVIVAWAILLVSIAIVAVYYDSLPADVVVARGMFDGTEIRAPKTLFGVFRVSAIEIVCGLAVTVMLYRKVRPGAQATYNIVWLILLFTTAFKSLFQSLELLSAPPASGLFLYITVAVITAGAVSAILFGVRAYAMMDRTDWKLSTHQKLFLSVLLILYIGFAIVPIYFTPASSTSG